MAKIQKGEVRNPYGRKGKPRADGERKSDGYRNLLSGYGTNRDPSEHTRPQFDTALTREYVEAVYRADGIGRRIVDLPAEEMTRQWVQIHGDDGDARLDDLANLNAKQQFNRALRWAGLYGGSIIVMLADDGSPDLSQPLNERRLRSINDLLVYDRHQVNWTKQAISQDPTSDFFGKPEQFFVSPINGTPFTVHRSRCIILDGEDIPDRLRSRNDGWGDSRLQAVHRALGRYAEGMGGTSAIIRDFILPVLSMKNLSDLIATGQEDVVKKRLEILGVSRSILNVLLIDSDDENYEKKASSVAGIDNLLGELKHNIAACVGMPQTLLFGRSPAGQNATGDADFRAWYDTVKGEQEDTLIPALHHLVRLLDIAAGTPEVEGRAVMCHPLWQPSQSEQVSTHKTGAEVVALLMDFGIIGPEAAERYISGLGIDTDEG